LHQTKEQKKYAYWPALRHASYFKFTKIVEVLLRYGANPNLIAPDRARLDSRVLSDEKLYLRQQGGRVPTEDLKPSEKKKRATEEKAWRADHYGKLCTLLMKEGDTLRKKLASAIALASAEAALASATAFADANPSNKTAANAAAAAKAALNAAMATSDSANKAVSEEDLDIINYQSSLRSYGMAPCLVYALFDDSAADGGNAPQLGKSMPAKEESGNMLHLVEALVTSRMPALLSAFPLDALQRAAQKRKVDVFKSFLKVGLDIADPRNSYHQTAFAQPNAPQFLHSLAKPPPVSEGGAPADDSTQIDAIAIMTLIAESCAQAESVLYSQQNDANFVAAEAREIALSACDAANVATVAARKATADLDKATATHKAAKGLDSSLDVDWRPVLDHLSPTEFAAAIAKCPIEVDEKGNAKPPPNPQNDVSTR
jgi:hypothetical protein